MEHNLSKINTGVRKSSKPYFFTVSTQTAMKAIVSDSVPTREKNFYIANRNYIERLRFFIKCLKLINNGFKLYKAKEIN